MVNKKKIGIAVLIIAVLLIIGNFFFGKQPPRYEKPPKDSVARKAWLSENIDYAGGNDFVYIDYDVPSWKKIEKMKKSMAMEPKYPAFMSAIQEYGSTTNTVDILYFADDLKDMGVNTYFIAPSYMQQYSKTKGEFELFYSGYKDLNLLSQDEARRALAHTILMAKEQGMAVILFPDYVELEDGGMARLGIADDLEDHLEKIALDLAQVAEDYQVEYFIPSNQIEMLLVTNGYSVEETVRRTNAFYARVVPKIREIYKGKILYKMGGFNKWRNYENISLEGADLFGFTGCYANDPDFISRDIKEAARMADKLSARYGIPWMNVEFLIRSAKDQERDLGGVKSDLPIEEYYQAGLEAFNQYAKNAVGFTVHSLLGSGKVYGTAAVPLIREFFAGRK